MADDTIRIGLVGAGANTILRRIPAFGAMEGVEIVSVANRSRGVGAEDCRPVRVAGGVRQLG